MRQLATACKLPLLPHSSQDASACGPSEACIAQPGVFERRAESLRLQPLEAQ